MLFNSYSQTPQFLETVRSPRNKHTQKCKHNAMIKHINLCIASRSLCRKR